MPLETYISGYERYGVTVVISNGDAVSYNSKQFDTLEEMEQQSRESYKRWSNGR